MIDLKPQLEKVRDELAVSNDRAYGGCAPADFKNGFNAAVALLWPVIENIECWKAASKRNRKNSDVKNYEEFALECMKAWDAVEDSLTALRDRLARGGRE